MEITTEQFVRNCKINGVLDSFFKEWIPGIIQSLKTDKKRDHAIDLLRQMQSIIADELIEQKNELTK